jgi:hypothetical protein
MGFEIEERSHYVDGGGAGNPVEPFRPAVGR